MVIAIVWHCIYPWDVRIEKFLTLLGKQGHKVHLICRGKNNLPKIENLSFGKIHRVFVPSSIFGSFLSGILSFPFFFNPVWVYQIAKSIKQNKIELIIVRDLPLALSVGIIGRILKIPVVLDMAENYPAALIAYGNPRYKPFLFNNGWMPRAYEKWSLKYMDHTFVVSEEQKNRLMKNGVSEKQLSCVLNTPQLDYFLKQSGCQELPGKKNDDGEILLYVGKIDKHRGVDVLIYAMEKIIFDYPEARLQIIGDGTERKRLMELTRKLNLEKHVIFEGWVEFSKLPRLIQNSTICVIPHLKSEHTDTTVPNKIFDYMALGKPVISSNCVPLERIIREEQCGLVFHSGDPSDLSFKVMELLSDRKMEVYGERGRMAVRKKYNWEKDSHTVLKGIYNTYKGKKKGSVY